MPQADSQNNREHTQVVERTDDLRDMHRIADRKHQHRNTESYPSRESRRIGQQRQRFMQRHVAGNLVLHPRTVKAELLAEFESAAHEVEIGPAVQEDLGNRETGSLRAAWSGSCRDRSRSYRSSLASSCIASGDAPRSTIDVTCPALPAAFHAASRSRIPPAADQRNRVDQCVGHRGGSFHLVPRQVQILDMAGLVLIAHAGNVLGVEILLPRAHATDIQRHVRSYRLAALLEIITHRHVDERRHIKRRKAARGDTRLRALAKALVQGTARSTRSGRDPSRWGKPRPQLPPPCASPPA